MRYIPILLIIFNILSAEAESNLLFLFQEEKIDSDFYRTGLIEYIEKNLEKNEVLRDKKKEKALKLFSKKRDSFFLGCKATLKKGFDFERAAHIGITNRYGQFYGTLKIFSKKKNRIFYENEFKGSKRDILRFYKDITQALFLNVDIIEEPVNVYSISESSALNSYLKNLYYLKSEKYQRVYDNLIYYKGNFDKYPTLKEMFDTASEKILADSLEIFNLPLEITYDKEGTESYEAETLITIIEDGYRTEIDKASVNPQSDEDYIDLKINLNIILRSGMKKKLISIFKKNKANLSLANMGKYRFSGTKNENAEFIDKLLAQRLTLKLYDEEGEVVEEGTVFISTVSYNEGRYQSKGASVFPLNPQGSTSDAFHVNRKTKTVIEIKDLEKEDFEKVKRIELQYSITK